MKKGLYAGSFDPVTNGHLDIILRASNICDSLVVGVMQNQSKQNCFSPEERVGMIRQCTSHLRNVEVDHFEGLLAQYVMSNHVDVVIRGLRATTDFELEMQMAQMNARLYDHKVETIFLMTAPDYSFISSSMMKEIYRLGGNVQGLVPDVVLEAMKKKFER